MKVSLNELTNNQSETKAKINPQIKLLLSPKNPFEVQHLEMVLFTFIG